jgi:adenine-specific DNA-methyltransferase
MRATYASNTGATAQLSLEYSTQPAATLPDLGFRVFKLDQSNIRAWNPKPDDLTQAVIDYQDHLTAGRTESDILYELLLKLGLDLCVPITTRQLAGLTVHAVGGGVLMACLAPAIANTDVDALAIGIVAWCKELAPAGDTTCVFRDSAFADDIAKTNLTAILEQHGIQNVRSL